MFPKFSIVRRNLLSNSFTEQTIKMIKEENFQYQFRLESENFSLENKLKTVENKFPELQC